MPVLSRTLESSFQRASCWSLAPWIFATSMVLGWTNAQGQDSTAQREGAKNATVLLANAEGASGKPASGAALPQGELPKDSGTAKENKTSQEKQRAYCFTDIADVPGGNLQFEANGQTFYLLTQKELSAASKDKASGKGKDDGGKKGRKAIKVRYTLYKVQRKTRKAEAVISVESRPNASLAVWADPAELVSVVAFAGRGANCFEGNAALTSISLTKTEQAAVSGLGLYQLVRGAAGSYLFDMKRSSIVEIDPETFQVKQTRSVSKEHRPLYWDAEKRRLTTWQEDGTQRGLVVFEGEQAKVSKRLAFKKGDRVLQQGGQFAAVRGDPSTNTLELQEVAEWSGQNKPGKYKLNIPPAYAVSQSSVSAHFGRRVAIVQGANVLTKTRWQRVFLFDYTQAKPLVVMPLVGRQYAHLAAIDPTGTYAVVEVRDIDSRTTQAARIFDFSKKTFEDIELPEPAEKKKP